QTSRRATKVPVAPFTMKTAAGARAWTHLLASLEDHLLLLDGRPGMLVDQAKELYRRTQGHIGSLTYLLDRARYLAITTGDETMPPAFQPEVTMDNAAEPGARTA